MSLLGGYAWSFIYLYNSELFPVQVSARTLGTVSFVSRQTVSLIPFCFTLAEKMDVHFLSTYLPFAVLGLVGSLALPGTSEGKHE